jgi:hypothetical protein
VSTDTSAKANGAANEAQAGDEGQALPPLFYSRPVPVSAAGHRHFRLRPETDFSFAQKANAIPVTLPEFVMAARHYPIIFIGDEHVPTIAVGLRPEDNLYVNVKGEWEANHYVPAYARRYPFILLGSDKDERLQLGIDDTANSTKPSAVALFEGDKETDAIRQALSLCEQFHGAYLFTAEFSKALAEAQITESRGLDVQLPNGETLNVGSFTAINEEKFKAMPDETFLAWRQKGWLHAVYFHLQSMNNWEFLLARASNRMAAAAAVA